MAENSLPCNSDDASKYSDAFYESQKYGSLASAKKVVPFIKALIPSINSVVDFGCGAGGWLKVFADMGSKVKGFDFGIGVPKNLLIDYSLFQNANLASPISHNEKYDLCISLEVAEHIQPTSSDIFIKNIATSADIILFSAAIPGQPGLNHINLQWPASWARRIMKYGFEPFDILRPFFWMSEEIAWWYRQNMILYIHTSLNSLFPKLRKFQSFRCQPIIHPAMLKLMK